MRSPPPSRSLEEFDFLLFSSVRDESQLPADESQARLATCLSRLDQLLATVPLDVLNKSKEMLEAANAP